MRSGKLIESLSYTCLSFLSDFIQLYNSTEKVSIEQKYDTEIRGELHDAQKLKEELIRNKIIKDIILELKLKYSTDRYNIDKSKSRLIIIFHFIVSQAHATR